MMNPYKLTVSALVYSSSILPEKESNNFFMNTYWFSIKMNIFSRFHIIKLFILVVSSKKCIKSLSQTFLLQVEKLRIMIWHIFLRRPRWKHLLDLTNFTYWILELMLCFWVLSRAVLCYRRWVGERSEKTENRQRNLLCYDEGDVKRSSSDSLPPPPCLRRLQHMYSDRQGSAACRRRQQAARGGNEQRHQQQRFCCCCGDVG